MKEMLFFKFFKKKISEKLDNIDKKTSAKK